MDQNELAAQALTSRNVPSQVKPLTSREFWTLLRLAQPAALVGRDASDIVSELSIAGEEADRICRLLDRSTALALATEALEHKGFWALTGVSEQYPSRLVARLGNAAPALFYGVGDRTIPAGDGIGVVGSRDIPPETADIARAVARFAASHDVPLVSGGARGVDQQAMDAAFERGGTVVGVLADSLERAVSDPSVRRGIASGHVCLVTPYGPSAPFSAGNAMGRNKIVYGLSRAVVVVRSDLDSGGTWAGATEAISKGYSAVYSWTGVGTSAGNAALVRKGAFELATEADIDERLLTSPGAAPSVSAAGLGTQLSLF